MDKTQTEAEKNYLITDVHIRLSVIVEQFDNIHQETVKQSLQEIVQRIEHQVTLINQPYKKYFGDFFTEISLYKNKKNEMG